MSSTLDETEGAINEVLATFPDPAWLPVVDVEGNKVSESCKTIDFYTVFNRRTYPDIYEGLRGKVILMIAGTHVRLFETLDSAMDFSKGLKSPQVIIPGIPLVDMTLDELEAGE